MTKLESYFDLDIHIAWAKCCAIWEADGRVQDFPHGMRRPWYNPSLGKRLGIEFAARFYLETDFFIEKLSSRKEFDRVCAFDLIEMVASEYEFQEMNLPNALTELDCPIPQIQYDEINSDHLFNDFVGRTVGEFLPFFLEHS